MIEITIGFVHPPIPTRDLDWGAFTDEGRWYANGSTLIECAEAAIERSADEGDTIVLRVPR